MARIDDITNRSAVLALAYGLHVAQGNLILHENNPLTGAHSQVTVLQALGEGEWDSLVQCFYAGRALTLTDYHFHPGSLSTGKDDPKQGVDSFFPGGITYNATAYVAARLPEGVSTDATPSDFKTVAKCLKVQNYDATGAPIKADGSYGLELQYSANPALVVADLILNRRELRRRRKFVGSIDTAANTFTTSRAHGLLTNWVVQVKAYGAGTLPAPLADATDYFVERVSDTVFKLYNGPVGNGGAVVDVTAAGTGSFQVIDSASRVDWPSWAALRDYSDENLSWVPGTGLSAEFFSDPELTTPAGKRLDTQLNFTWTNQSPGFGLSANWSVRWTGKVRAAHTETYTFYARYDDSARVWVNGVQLINDWSGGAARETSGTIALTADTDYDIVVEYQQFVGPGELSVSWSSPSTPKQLLPTSALTAGNLAIKRFESHMAFTGPTELQNALQQVMFTCASDMQERGGRVGFLLPLPAIEEGAVDTFNAGRRRIVHDFTEDNVVRGTIKAYQLDKRDRWNRVKGHYRNVHDEFISEDYVYDEREALRDQVRRTVDPGQIELGNMTKSQADRILKWNMRNKSDLTIFCELRGMGDSFHVLPGDVVRVTHSLYGWVQQLFLVIDATDESGESTADERVFVLHEYQQTYFDNDHGPIQSRVVGTPATGLEPPLAPVSVTVEEENRLAKDGSVVTCIRGEVVFGAYAGRQRGRVWLKKPADSDFEPTSVVVVPDATTGAAAFELTGLATGNHRVKVVTESTFGVPGGETVATPDPIELLGRVVAPSTPANLSYETGDNGQIVFTCDPWVDSDISHMRVFDGNGVAVGPYRRVDSHTWTEPPSKFSFTRKVKFVSSSGVESAFSNTVTYDPPALPALSALSVVRSGSTAVCVFRGGDLTGFPSYLVDRDRRFLVEVMNGGVAVRSVELVLPKDEIIRWTKRSDLGDPSVITVDPDGTARTAGNASAAGYAESQVFTETNISFIYEVDERCPPNSFAIIPATLEATCTVDTATDTVTAAGAEWTDKDPVYFTSTGTLPAPFTVFTEYYVVEANGLSFKVSDSIGGTPINITSAGTGTLTVRHQGTGIYLDTHITGGDPYVWGELAGSTSSIFTRRAVPGDRFAIVLEDRQATYVENPPSAPFFRSNNPPAPGHYKLLVVCGYLGGEAQAALRCYATVKGPNSFYYTVEMQQADFGSAQNPVTFRVREISDGAVNGPTSTASG